VGAQRNFAEIQLSPFLFAMVIDEVTENARKGGKMKEILYADDLARS